MKLLLDTHALIWWVEDNPKLSLAAAEAIETTDDRVFFSAASIWEIATKVRIGKLKMTRPLSETVHDLSHRARLDPLAISIDHAQLAGELPGPHKDPFDRMLIAQTRLDDLALVTSDPVFQRYRVKVIW